MTGRTHDLAAFTALAIVITYYPTPLPHISLATGLVAFSANMIGGLAPDLDQPTADLWHKLPAGGLYSRVITPLFGGHRYISHSLLGIALFGIGLHYLLDLAHTVLLVDMTIVWWTFMIGFVSHLIMDTFTREGVPWLFPIPIKFGVPPLARLRIKTSGLFEKTLVFPGLILINAFIFYNNYGKFLAIFHKLN